jgi:hypothetical protein
MPEQLAKWDYQWSQVVGQAWADDSFKHRLFANPTATLKEYGMDMPSGLQVKVLEDTEEVPENTGTIVHLVLPARPSDEDLLEEELVGGVGGQAVAYCHHCGCYSCYRCYRCGCGGCARSDS